MMITLKQWMEEHDFFLQEPDASLYASNLDDEGFAAYHNTEDFSLWVGRNCVIRNTSAGTRSDECDRYVARTWPGFVAIADAAQDEDGLSREELSDFVFGGDAKQIVLQNRDEI